MIQEPSNGLSAQVQPAGPLAQATAGNNITNDTKDLTFNFMLQTPLFELAPAHTGAAHRG
jgi:hypothetical protein